MSGCLWCRIWYVWPGVWPRSAAQIRPYPIANTLAPGGNFSARTEAGPLPSLSCLAVCAPVEMCGGIVLCVAHPVMGSRPLERVRWSGVGSHEAISRWRDRQRQTRCHSARPWSPEDRTGMAPGGVLQLATVACGGGLGMEFATPGRLRLRRGVHAGHQQQVVEQQEDDLDGGWRTWCAGSGRHSVERAAR